MGDPTHSQYFLVIEIVAPKGLFSNEDQKLKVHKSTPILTWGRALRKLIIHAVQRKILVFFEALVLAFKGQTIAYNRSREIHMIILELKYNPKMRKKLRILQVKSPASHLTVRAIFQKQSFG